jgi:tetratricopeptide (TPR) repeat protein
MRKEVLRNHRLMLVIACLLLSPIFIVGQDLGSSSGLFRKKSSTTKKTSDKKKTKKAERKSSPKKTSTSTKRASRVRKKQSLSNNRSASKRPANFDNRSEAEIIDKDNQIETARNNVKPAESIIIKVGETNGVSNLELFEQEIAKGNRARNLREYVDAEDAYKAANLLNPNDSRAIYGLGNIFSDQQRWEEAEQAYRRAIQLDPDNHAAHIAISFVLTQPVVGSNLGRRYEEAEKMARRAMELDPENALVFDQLGVALELRGLIGKETENAYRKAIELSPDFALAYAHLGRLLRRHGLTKESSAAYRKAIQLSNDAPTMILVADVMQSQQRYLESEELLREALRQDPKNPTALYLLGRALTTRKSFVEAESVLKKSVQVSPNSFVSYTLLASLSYQSGKLDKAEQTLTEALNVFYNNEKKRLAQEFETVGDLFLKAKMNADAFRVYNRAKMLDKTNSTLSAKLRQAQNN